MTSGPSTNISARSRASQDRRRQVPFTTSVFEADAGNRSLISLECLTEYWGDPFVHVAPVWVCPSFAADVRRKNSGPAQVIGNQSRVTSSRNQQVLRERPLAVDPLPVAVESRTRRHPWNFFDLILVRALRPDGFIFVQHEPQAGGRNAHRLPERRAQVHFDASFHAVPP